MSTEVDMLISSVSKNIHLVVRKVIKNSKVLEDRYVGNFNKIDSETYLQ